MQVFFLNILLVLAKQLPIGWNVEAVCIVHWFLCVQEGVILFAFLLRNNLQFSYAMYIVQLLLILVWIKIVSNSL